MSAFTDYIDRRFYSSFGANWDATLFRSRVEPHIETNVSLLDFGAGRGALDAMNFQRPNRFVAAVDVDDAVLANPRVDEARLIDANGVIPYPDDRFDVVLAHNVLEHLPDPLATFREIRRVLRPGGVFMSKTPNRLHYVPLIAHLTPHRFHVWINQRRGSQSFDTFPTLYRANTASRIDALARRAGLAVESIELVEGRPEYLRQNAALYVAGLCYERIVNAAPVFNGFRVVMISTLRKFPP